MRQRERRPIQRKSIMEALDEIDYEINGHDNRQDTLDIDLTSTDEIDENEQQEYERHESDSANPNIDLLARIDAFLGKKDFGRKKVFERRLSERGFMRKQQDEPSAPEPKPEPKPKQPAQKFIPKTNISGRATFDSSSNGKGVSNQYVDDEDKAEIKNLSKDKLSKDKAEQDKELTLDDIKAKLTGIVADVKQDGQNFILTTSQFDDPAKLQQTMDSIKQKISDIGLQYVDQKQYSIAQVRTSVK